MLCWCRERHVHDASPGFHIMSLYFPWVWSQLWMNWTPQVVKVEALCVQTHTHTHTPSSTLWLMNTNTQKTQPACPTFCILNPLFLFFFFLNVKCTANPSLSYVSGSSRRVQWLLNLHTVRTQHTKRLNTNTASKPYALNPPKTSLTWINSMIDWFSWVS